MNVFLKLIKILLLRIIKKTDFKIRPLKFYSSINNNYYIYFHLINMYFENAKKKYLGSPYGFDEHWRLKLFPEFIGKLVSMGAKVFEPFARNTDVDLSIPDLPIKWLA